MRTKRVVRGQLQVLLGIAASCMIAFTASPATAQDRETALINRIEQQMLDAEIERRLADHRGQTFGEQLTLDYGASLRFGWAKLDSANHQPYGLRQYEANLYLQATASGGHRVFGNLRFLYNQYYNSTNTNNGMLDPIGNRYWYQFDLGDWQKATEGAAGPVDFTIRAGRQFINWNTGLVWSNDLYGAKMRVAWDDFSIEGLAGVSARSGLYDFDVSRPNYDTDTNRHAYAIRADYEFAPWLKPWVSYFMQRDHNDDSMVVPVLGRVEFEYDSNYLSFGANGSIGSQFLYGLEMCWESGTGYSTPVITPTGVIQPKDDIDSWAGILNLVYLLQDSNSSRIECTLGFGTGDADRLSPSGTFAGNWPGTTDQAFNSLGYINTGLALAPSMTNLLMARVGANTAIPINPAQPDDLRVGVDFFVFGKTTKNAQISTPTINERFVGWECDLKVDWRITSDVSFNFRYGLFVPNGGVPEPSDQVRQFVYGGISYAF